MQDGTTQEPNADSAEATESTETTTDSAVDTTPAAAAETPEAVTPEAEPPAAAEPAPAASGDAVTVDGLIFDLDGTLVDTREDIAASVNAAMSALERPALDTDEIWQHVGHGVYNLMSKALGTEDEEILTLALTAFGEHYAEHCLDQTTAYPGALEVLEHFKDKPCAVVSNKPEDFCRKILNGLGLDHNLMAIIGGDTVGLLKPDPLPVNEALDLMGVEATNVVLVGDDVQDIEGGRAAGTRTCAVTYGLGDKEKLSSAAPDYTVDDLSSLAQIFA